ncbi:hypothetical protein E1264_22720 [Actinomadura sp. KC216]|uniref:hypothetical protein n=1 Tax=Actinomadura sp. KC216 TaxID=2530370 RepID=UPI00104FEF87|nr:hypothetical protein [Actinomadura sp. KC216]TDB84975.1 hypothetical protein E1264_22720 [Actinomadura sp. KC216]
MLAALGVQPAHAAGPTPSLAVETVPVSGAAPASVAAAAAAEEEVCDAGQTYRSRVFRTDTKRVVYTFTVFVKRCAIGDLAFTRELGFDAVEPAVPDPIIFTRLRSSSLPGRAPQSVTTYEGVLQVDACFGNPCQLYEHKFFGLSTSTFQTGRFQFLRLQ